MKRVLFMSSVLLCIFALLHITAGTSWAHYNSSKFSLETPGITIASSSSSSDLIESDQITVILNGKKLIFDENPYIKNGRTLVPFRKILEELDAQVEWNPVDKSVYAKNRVTSVYLKIGESHAYVNGYKVELDAPAEIKNGRTFLPLRFISENMGAYVVWDGVDRIVTIQYNNSSYNLGELVSYEDLKIVIDEVDKNVGGGRWKISGRGSFAGKKVIINIVDDNGNDAPAIITRKGAGQELENFEADVYLPAIDFTGKYIIISVIREDKKLVRIAQYLI
ncbi:MAG: copper amine oxidase N-terminal domain-containing protein [Bacillota bacterium]